MVCGIDSFHDTTRAGGSVAGFVASLNQTFTRWFSRVCFQGPNQELVDGLKTCFISALKCYYDVSIQLICMCTVFNFGFSVTAHGLSLDCAWKREILHVESSC
jgi:Piwi domain.